MKLHDGPITVEAPASTANLGPGFDALALALDMHLRVTVTPLDHGSEQLVVEGEGANEIGMDAGNRFLIGLERGLQVVGLEPPIMRIEMNNEIPLARGLGSSAAAVVAGLRAAEALSGSELGIDRMHAIASDVDGHPDNVGAALLGGFVIVARDGAGAPRAAHFEPPDNLVAALFIPAKPLRTAEMRATLPAQVAHEDAAHNISRAAMVVAALTANRPELLRAMAEDRLHEPQRAAHFEALPGLIATAQKAGALGAALSGAGSTVIALCAETATATKVAAAMHEYAKGAGVDGRSTVVRPTAAGARQITEEAR
ncbi:MAG TPA: homoserine kinase [Candidatus Limnocylindria bacterium]|nr:homoserine kinase [Candidatus Limnocylindria bacterium]